MPIYEYRCQKGHSFEVMQRMSDDPLAQCTICGTPVQRVFHPVAVHFKGKGFYTTDYGKGAPASTDGKPDSGTDSDSTSSKSEDKKQDSKDSKKAESSTKSAAKD
ncbi:MAG: zinc ribbon domain-containing protein [Actinomycetota bacterium]|nr:zinc ribbon domain-containing protein [Actinomycetota bacterium]